jgi:hypothetical protein
MHNNDVCIDLLGILGRVHVLLCMPSEP